MKIELSKTHNDVPGLGNLNDFAYENIFNVYTQDDFYAYNILRTVKIPENLDPSTFTYVKIAGKISWTSLSFLEYRTIRLWWLICIANGILNPVILPEPGTVIKIITPASVRSVIDSIKSQVAQK
jgi:ABC-type nitrate/sulfonate/bicarbonate transport system permease component